MSNNSTLCNNLFSSLISEIKNYNGRDPLLPWLRGIRKMRESLPPQLLKEKLPRFLQKCAQTFQTDRRYSNDMRYLRVWLQLMDFVDDPKAILRTMEANHIGIKKALFYQAYALYYEKLKKFDAAEKMYHLGVQDLAEPVDELQKSYEQFLRRVDHHKNKRNQGGKTTNVLQPATGNRSWTCGENKENLYKTRDIQKETQYKLSLLEKQSTCTNAKDKKPLSLGSGHELLTMNENHSQTARNLNNTELSCNSTLKKGATSEVGRKIDSQKIRIEDNNHRKFYGEDTVVVKFVDTAIIGKSAAEDARHHGLVEPTINTKEAMNAINNMFREPLEPSLAGRKKSNRNQSKTDRSMEHAPEVLFEESLDAKAVPSSQILRQDSSTVQTDNSRHQDLQEPLQIFIDEEENDKADQSMEHALEILIDESFDAKALPSSQTLREDSSMVPTGNSRHQSFQEPLQIFIDEEENDKLTETDETDELDQRNYQTTGGAYISIGHFDGFVFPCPSDAPSECLLGLPAVKPHQAKFREDTVVCRFVGSTILDELEVENVCHHGLVDPTVNLKEAMDDINSMFGKPIEFARKSRPKKQEKANHSKSISGGFLILPDEELESHVGIMSNSSAKNESDLFEQTICTREAMDEINKMFGMPLDF